MYVVLQITPHSSSFKTKMHRHGVSNALFDMPCGTLTPAAPPSIAPCACAAGGLSIC